MRFQGAGISKQSAGITSLLDVVTTQISLAEHCGVLDVATSPIWVIVCPDATPLRRTSATRYDVFVDCWGDIDAASDPRRWVTWWALDGPEDAGCLRGMDRCGGFNNEVKVLQEECDVLVNGVTHRFHVSLTGDGKLMEVSNKDVGGSKCWSCDKDDCPIPRPMIDGTIRWGAFLRGILCRCGIGDYVHGCCRVANAFVKRLGATCLDWIQNDGDDKRGLEELRALWHEFVLDAQHIPHAQHLAPRPHKAGQMDLTAARLFWQCKEKQRNLVRILE